MLKIGDTVKVIGKTLNGNNEESELIPIGTICRVADTNYDDKVGNMVELIPSNKFIGYHGYWYLECDVEKGHLEWVMD